MHSNGQSLAAGGLKLWNPKLSERWDVFAGMLVVYGILLPTKSGTFRNFVVNRRAWTLSLV